MKKLSYSEQLKHPNWQRKRLEVLERAGFECVLCHDKDKTLHVHHKQYLKGRMAWEYDADELVVLCEPCHEREHAELEQRAAIMARLDVDGPLSMSDFIAYGAGAIASYSWMVERPLMELISQVGEEKAIQFQAGRAGALLGDMVLNKSGMLHVADLISADDEFRAELLALLKKYGVQISGWMALDA